MGILSNNSQVKDLPRSSSAGTPESGEGRSPYLPQYYLSTHSRSADGTKIADTVPEAERWSPFMVRQRERERAKLNLKPWICDMSRKQTRSRSLLGPWTPFQCLSRTLCESNFHANLDWDHWIPYEAPSMYHIQMGQGSPLTVTPVTVTQ